MVAVASPVGVGRRGETRSEPIWSPTLAPALRPARLPASTYRRRRAVAAGLALALVLLLSAALGMLGGGPLPVPERPGSLAGRAGITYVVQPGDTFWSIATELHPRADPRPLVDRMVAAHGSPVLHVGELIRVPAP